LPGFAANGAIGARATTTIGPTVVTRRVLRKFSADLVADTFDLIGVVPADRALASEGRDTKAENADQDDSGGQFSHDNLQQVRHPLKIVSSVPFPERAVFNALPAAIDAVDASLATASVTCA